MAQTDKNYFVDYSPTNGVRFDKGRLQLHFVPSSVVVPAVDLDLIQEPDGSWEGRFHRGDFDSRIKLLRPGAGRGFARDPAVGTWSENQTGFPVRSCLHIAQQTATEWTGWSDSLTVLGSVQYAPHLSKPATAMERYGELVDVARKQDGSFSFTLDAFTGVCCSRRFVGTLAPAGALLEGTWLSGPNQITRQGSWTKMSADSCLSGEPVD